MQSDKSRLAIDIGGTFTDAALQLNSGDLVSVKTPTTPEDPVIGAMTAVQLVLAKSNHHPREIGLLIHGTTLATNTLIEKKGARVGVVVTQGFRDILEIGYERRYNQGDLFIDKPDLMVPRERCFTVTERCGANGDILIPLDSSSLDRLVESVRQMEVESVAICLLHAYANDAHEQQIKQFLEQKCPEISLSVSSGVSAEVREFDRLTTTVANAYVKPMMESYLNNFSEALQSKGFSCPFRMMTSAGGMTTLETAGKYPIRLVESGPSGGAILAARVARQCGLANVLSFDMGGTTAKFCLIDQGKPLTTRHFEIARAERFIKASGIPIRIPAIELIEIGAGGGSIARVDLLNQIRVGPESQGSEPGPACFGRGGQDVTVTDADAVLGYIEPGVFGDGQLEINLNAASRVVADSIGERLNLDAVNAAFGVSQMVGENMANAGRVHAAERGTALGQRTMIAFGGNGPLHGSRVALKMGVNEIVIPLNPGVGSAVGFLSAPVSFEIVSSLYTRLDEFKFDQVNRLFNSMVSDAEMVVKASEASQPLVQIRTGFMRYAGQGHEIEVRLPNRDLVPEDLELLGQEYEKEYRRQFKRTVPGMKIEIMNWAITLATELETPKTVGISNSKTYPSATSQRQVYFGPRRGSRSCDVYNRNDLVSGDQIPGPALIIESQTSTLVEPEFTASIDDGLNIWLRNPRNSSEKLTPEDQQTAVDFQLMWNRLLALVEEQGQILVRSAFSPIVRECGDISAGVFDRNGNMLAQAVTGTPGHINTMAEGVKNFFQTVSLEDMRQGDIYVTNDPWLAAGHLNDFMLIQPVFNQGEVIGFTSCTSHLVDVGGLCMGPQGSDIYDEGLLIPPCLIVQSGVVNPMLLDIIKANSRQPVESEGDLYALIACCEVGADRLSEMLQDYYIENLEALSGYIIDTSRKATETAIACIPDGVYSNSLALDGYDFAIELHGKMTVVNGEITLDLTGSSPCSKFGINVPLNYTAAYSVFAMSCVVAAGVPNNAGSLAPFKVVAPEGCIVNAVHPMPVAMRHTVGQLLPDLVFGCLHQALPDKVPAEGASCMYDIPMRNLPNTNDPKFAIELVHNGGTGARPNKDGLSATAYPSGVWGSQVEVTEATVPIHVSRRELREDSAGAGRHRGGLGQILELKSSQGAPFILFLSLDRMKYPARGFDGGQPGAPGRVTLNQDNVLPGRGEQVISPGDLVRFETPGGGGFGSPYERDPQQVADDVNSGLVSIEAAARSYGVTFGFDGEIDWAETQLLRKQKYPRI